jgi:3-methyladenine DNA glycosylase AlkC
MSDPEYPALKEMFNAARLRRIARDVQAVYPAFDTRHFLRLGLDGLNSLNLLQRLRRVTESLHATLPTSYPRALKILRELAPRTETGFVSLFLPDFVGQYGRSDVPRSLDALRFFTRFGSSEFGIRPFLRDDLLGTLRVMETWSRDPDEHVRRLASEGCRPRLPWSFRLDALVADPSPVAPILHTLRADPSLYVRKSVANHLNDISKDHPEWVLEILAGWDLGQSHSAWIVKRALRTLIKAGDRRALGVIGAGRPAVGVVEHFAVTPSRISLGQQVEFSLVFRSTARTVQKLVIDYAIHYVKKSGAASAKVFKWKEGTISPGDALTVQHRQTIRDFSTRRHHPGRHEVELLINGQTLARCAFDLQIPH